MSLERFKADVTPETVIAALNRDGAVIIESLANDVTIDRVVDEFRPEFDRVGTAVQNDFNGYTTLRIASVLGFSPTSADLIGHPLVLEVADSILLPNCVNYRIGSTSGIEIHPGEAQQVLHRDDSMYPLRVPGVEWQFSALWALDDFTIENGATHVVPQSHLQIDSEIVPVSEEIAPATEESVQASMHASGWYRTYSPVVHAVSSYQFSHNFLSLWSM